MRKLPLLLFILCLAKCIAAQYANNSLLCLLSSRDILTQHQVHLPVTRHQLVVIAHRGSHATVPENTLAAYENAIEEGADYVEMDLRTTKDGHLVIMHDESVKKMTGEKAFVKELTYGEISKLKIKPVLKEDTITYRVPDFGSVLNVCKGRINIYLDFKDADVGKTYQMIRQAGMQNHVVVYLNKEEQYGLWRKVAPQIPLMASLPENMNIYQLNNFIDKNPLEVVDNAYSNDELSQMKKRKIAVWLDVQGGDEGPAKWEKALRSGVTGLQTDHPGKLIKYLKEERMR